MITGQQILYGLTKVDTYVTHTSLDLIEAPFQPYTCTLLKMMYSYHIAA